MPKSLREKSPSPRRAARRTQAERTAESTRKLLDAAADLFATQGYDRTTFAQIAARAGYSSGLVAQRFGSKSNLLDTLVRDIRQQTQAEFLAPAISEPTAVGRVDRTHAFSIPRRCSWEGVAFAPSLCSWPSRSGP